MKNMWADSDCMLRIRGRQVAAVFLTTVVATGLAACSSSSNSASSTSAAPESSTSVASESSTAPMGQDPATWSPVEITPEMLGTTVELVVGQRAVFRLPPAASEAEGGYAYGGYGTYVEVDFGLGPSGEATVKALRPGTSVITIDDIVEGERVKVGSVTFKVVSK